MSDLTDATQSPAENKPRLRPQISLAMMFALVVIVALAISHIVQSYKLNREIESIKTKYDATIAENKKMRLDFGILVPENPNLICATKLPSYEMNTERYRIYYPPNKRFIVNCACEDIPVRGFAVPLDSSTSFQSDAKISHSDEIVVHYKGDTVTVTMIQGSTTSQGEHHYRDRPRRVQMNDEGVQPHQVTVQKPGQPIVILRRTETESNSKPLKKNEIAKTGLLIWIEEAALPKGRTPTPISPPTPPTEKSRIGKK